MARYNGPGNSTDEARAMAVDGSGNVYVAGVSAGSDGYFDYATIKYDTGGNQVWVARYNGPGNADDMARALAVDGAGNVYVTGYSAGIGTSSDYATIKYSASAAPTPTPTSTPSPSPTPTPSPTATPAPPSSPSSPSSSVGGRPLSDPPTWALLAGGAAALGFYVVLSRRRRRP
ncbi:MAG: SBBP repeat-containing protein [Chloroflexi bacterium]|nr:SBBP repeat-containing protein [Chloroflexota bacterium]